MPRHAEPREFGLSEYQRSRYRLFAALCGLASALSLGEIFLDPIEGSAATLILSIVALVTGLSGWLCWLKAKQAFARLSPYGITINDGALLPWSSSWSLVYAIETPGERRAELRLAGSRCRRVSLTMFEREDRRAFVEAVRQWIYSSH